MTDHDYREMHWRLKQANKTMGRQGQTIAALRGELARVREEHSNIERGELRRLERENAKSREAAAEAAKRVQHYLAQAMSDRAEIERLNEKLEIQSPTKKEGNNK